MEGFLGVFKVLFHDLCSVYYGVNLIIICEAPHLFCGFFCICVIYFTIKRFIYIFKEKINDKAMYLKRWVGMC